MQVPKKRRTDCYSGGLGLWNHGYFKGLPIDSDHFCHFSPSMNVFGLLTPTSQHHSRFIGMKPWLPFSARQDTPGKKTYSPDISHIIAPQPQNPDLFPCLQPSLPCRGDFHPPHAAPVHHITGNRRSYRVHTVPVRLRQGRGIHDCSHLSTISYHPHINIVRIPRMAEIKDQKLETRDRDYRPETRD